MSPVFLSDSFYFQIGTSSVSTGAATNADSTPVVSVEEDGTLMGYAPTVTNITTGLYRVQVDCTAGNGFEAGKRYSMYAVATVGAVTGRDGVGEFEVLAVDLNTGVASVTGLNPALLDVAISTRAAPGDDMGLLAAELLAIADAILARNIAGGSTGGRDVTSALRALRNKVELLPAGAPTGVTVYAEDDATPAWTGTVGTSTRDALVSVDPA